MKRRLLSIGLASLLLGLVFDLLFYGKMPGISFFLFCGTLLAVTFWLVFYNKLPQGKFATLVSLPILVYSAFVSIRASELLTFLNITFVLYLLLILVQLLSGKQDLSAYSAREYIRKVMLLPFAFVRELFIYAQELLDSRSSLSVNKKPITPVIRGTLLSLPFLFIFIILFSSADLVFKQYVGSLFDFNLPTDLIGHLLLIGFITCICFGVYGFIFTQTRHEIDMAREGRAMKLGSVETSIILGSVAFIFLVFVLIQVAYLFGGQGHLNGTEFTYAEYARKGFFELVAVSVITLVLLLVVNKSSERKELKNKVTFMWLSGFLILEVMVIMLSAHKRLGLYEQAYGFTVARLFSHIFVGWLALVFVFLFIHILREQKENVFAFQVFLSAMGFLLILNLINPDALIARKNIDRFKATGKIDPYYLFTLSEDATPVTAELLKSSNKNLSQVVANRFYIDQEFDRFDGDESWQSFNVSRNRARDIWDENQKILEENKNFQGYFEFE